jgi:hypothetical protein
MSERWEIITGVFATDREWFESLDYMEYLMRLNLLLSRLDREDES